LKLLPKKSAIWNYSKGSFQTHRWDWSCYTVYYCDGVYRLTHCDYAKLDRSYDCFRDAQQAAYIHKAAMR
jgi:hypothetical protein